MRAGRRDRKIDIQICVPTDTTSGDSTDVWSSHVQPWAHVKWIKADRKHLAHSDFSESEVVFTIPYIPTVTDDMRVVMGGKNYIIDGLIENGRQRALEIYAHSEVS